MKKTTLLSVAVLFLVGSFATVAVAGTVPSPFDQLNAISLDVKLHGKELDVILDMPICESSPARVRRTVVELHNIAFRLGWFSIHLKGSLLGVELVEIESPGDLDLTCNTLKGRVKWIINRADDSLAGLLDPCPVEIIGAVLNVKAEAVVLLKTVNKIIRKLRELYGCTEDSDCGCVGTATPCESFKDQDSCVQQQGCIWDIAIDPAACIGTPTPCSDIGPIEGCANQAGCSGGICGEDGFCQ